MHDRLLSQVYILVIALLAYGSAHAQTVAPAAGSVTSVVREAFVVRPFDDIDLPQGSVRSVHISQGGYLWAGTREGLVQYKSGQQTTWHQSRDGINGLPSGVINTIHEDPQNTIWVGTARGIAKLAEKSDNFSIVAQSAEGSSSPLDVLEILDFRDGLLSVCTGGQIILIENSGVTTISGLELFPDETLLSAVIVDDRLFVGGISGRIYQLAFAENSFHLVSTIRSASPVVDLAYDGESLIWLDREQGLVWTDLPSKDGLDAASPLLSSINPLQDDAQGYYRAMSVDTPQSAWFAAGPSVIRMRDSKADIVRLPGRGNEVRSIAVDNVGNIWIGTYYGLYYALDTRFTVLQTASAYDAGVILSLAAAGDELFLGGQNLWSGNIDAQRFTEFRASLPAISQQRLRIDPQSVGQSPITALAATQETLLVGYHVGGMDVVDRTNGLVTNFTHTQDGQSLEGVGVSGLVQVAPDTWLASLYLYGLVELQVENRGSSPPLLNVTRVAEQETLIGVYQLDDSTYIAVDQNEVLLVERAATGDYSTHTIDSLPGGIVFAVEPDGAGGVFLGIENAGVRQLSREMLQQKRYAPQSIPVVEQYLQSNTIWHLMLDSENTLWATTNQGIYAFDLSKQEMLAHLTYADGLPSNEFDYSPHAKLKASNGDRLFVSAKVPVVFSDTMRTREEKLRLFWTDVTLNGDPFSASKISTVNPRATLSVDFADVATGLLEINYGYDDHVKASELSYAMRYGSNGEWLPQSGPTVQIARQQYWGELPIQIAMLDTDGKIASQPLSVIVNIAPPAYIFWVLDLRYVMPAILLTAAVLLYMQRRSRRNQRRALAEANTRREVYEAEMRGRLSEKEILLRELHHRVGNLLTNFSSGISAMQRSAKQAETKESLANLNARLKVQSAVHHLLQRSDRTDVNIADVINRVSYGVRDLFQGIDGRSIDLELEDIYITYSKAQYLGLIVNELLTNTYKHGSCPDALHVAKMRLSYSDENEEMHFSYQDYGRGADEEALATAFVRKRYSELRGLGQVVGLARELGGEPLLYNDGGLRFELSIQSTTITPGRAREDSGHPYPKLTGTAPNKVAH